MWKNRSPLDVFRPQDGDNPLCSPVEKKVSVAVTLTPEWNFSAIYPVAPAKPLLSIKGERIRWNVRMRLDGNLMELNTGPGSRRHVSLLEAE
ncbi:hypothetical protein C8F04DRAFT_967183 [Mycena alexandri]|uniref:Uncharacterized protein n=1 Tax=Mycena alexandri TaxID=1745969 RepID=A0AAD6WV04_9AGAR|nr:hypothetical protein C8F04DRAFT_967183 [Mycena alexandri]